MSKKHPKNNAADSPEVQQAKTAAAEQPPVQTEQPPAAEQGWLSTQKAKAARVSRRWNHIVHEKRARHFPESERVPIQLALFAWGAFPFLWHNIRKTFRRFFDRITAPVNRLLARMERKRKVSPLAFMLFGLCLAAVVFFFSIYTVGTTVSYDGDVVASVSSRSAARSAREALEEITAKTLKKPSYTIDDDLITFRTGLMHRDEIVDRDELEDELSHTVGLVSGAYGLYVDGELVGATPYKGALEELLHQLETSVSGENTVSCTFKEKVDIRHGYVPADKVMNLGYLAESMYSTKTDEVSYTVAKGDTWSQIAESHGLTWKELLALNPGYDIDKLQIGEVLTLSASAPYLTMTVVQREHYVEEIPFDVETLDSQYLFKGDYKVVKKGEYGAAETLATVTYVNGEETQRKVLSSVPLKDPVTERRLVGVKERPTWTPTGNFRWPVTGHITSGFGPRRSPGGIGSRNHKGIDIAARYGTPVCAADGGTVTYSGWMGGYGYIVIIDHGNGYETRYGHNSSLTVSVGQHVYKGQQIARIGSTGNSTGNHCHFEVRYHGVPKNPRNYLP